MCACNLKYIQINKSTLIIVSPSPILTSNARLELLSCCFQPTRERREPWPCVVCSVKRRLSSLQLFGSKIAKEPLARPPSHHARNRTETKPKPTKTTLQPRHPAPATPEIFLVNSLSPMTCKPTRQRLHPPSNPHAPLPAHATTTLYAAAATPTNITSI